MKRKHTTKKSANRGFTFSKTGFMSEEHRKASNKFNFNPDKSDARYTKPKKGRAKRQITETPTY